MAIRVQTQDIMVFGILEADTAVTHGRVQKAGAAPVVRALSAAVNVAAGERLRISTGMFDIVYPAGQLNNVHMMAIVSPYWAGETFQVDMMTDTNTVVATTGYAQQEYSNWSITAESD